MQLRTFIAASVIGLSLACVAGFASAQQIYKWKDANGVMHYSQTPPSSSTHYTKMQLTSQPEVASDTPASSNSETEGTPQNRAALRAAAPGGTQPDTPSNRAGLCKQLSANIALLQSKQPVVTDGSDGKQQVMSDNTREQQLANARAQQVQYCSSPGS
jgi:hypothetical protein